LDTSLEALEPSVHSNTAWPIPVNEWVVRHLVETGQPASIVNILSMVADCAQSYLTPYSASKEALATPPRDDVQLAMIQNSAGSQIVIEDNGRARTYFMKDL
jgi:hypothetical protein